MTPRPYQVECIDNVFARLAEHRSTLAVLATGLGKTVIFATVASRWPLGRVLVLAHREELVRQAAEKLESVTGEKPDVEMADQTARTMGFFGGGRYVVASVQSLTQDSRLKHPVYRPDLFGLVIVDEAHHCVPGNKSYGRIIDHFQTNPACKLLGVTATPDRADGLAMGGYFDSVAYDFGIREGVLDAWLSPIEQQYVAVQGLDFSEVRTKAGDLSDADLERIIAQEQMLHKLVGPTIDAAGSEPTLIFTPGVASAEMAAEILNRHKHGSAVCLHGKTPRDVRRLKLGQFAKREFQFLCGCGLFLEGFDEPTISVIAMARPTKSRALYAQAIGRGTRTLPGVLTPGLSIATAAERGAAIAGSDKPRLLVLDFVGNSGKHKLITTADILAGKESTARSIERARKQAVASGKPVNLLTAMDRCEQEMAEEDAKRKEAEAKAQAELAAATKRLEDSRRQVKAKAEWEGRTVDPFGDGMAADRSAGFGQGNEGAPAHVLARLEKAGINTQGMTKKDANRAYAEVIRRAKAGEWSHKQEKLLRRSGGVQDKRMSRTKAGVLIDVLIARGYKAFDYPLTRDRLLIKAAPGGHRLAVRDTRCGIVGVGQTFPTPEACRQHYEGICDPSSMGAAA